MADVAYTIFFDLETGGVQPTDPNIQIAAVVMEERTWTEVGFFERKIQFSESTADPEALKLIHYDAEIWRKEAIPLIRIPDEFLLFTKPYLSITMVSKRTGEPYKVGKLAGHNALSFDLPRLRQIFGTRFFPFSYHVKDTLQRALWYYDEHPEVTRPENLKLGTLCSSFGIEIDGSHDALTDVRLCAKLARAFQLSEVRV